MPRKFKSRWLRLLAHPGVLVLALTFLIIDVLNLPHGPKEVSSVALSLRGMHPGGSSPRPIPVEFYRTPTGLAAVGTGDVKGAGEIPAAGVRLGGLMIWPRDYTTHGFWAPTTLRRYHRIVGHESLSPEEFALLPLVLAARLEAMGEEDRKLVLLRAGVLGDTHLIRRGVAHNGVVMLVSVLLLTNVILGVVMLRRWWSHRQRRARGLCPDCGYNLRHQYIGGCPECGWSRAAVPHTRAVAPTASSRP